MGIYDREYVRVGRRSKAGVGAFRMWSVNTWLIAINVAVFVIDAILGSSHVSLRTDMGTVYLTGATSQQIAHAVVTPATTASHSLAGAMAELVVDSRGQTFDPAVLAAAQPVTINGQPAVVIGGAPYEIIGEKRFSRRPPLEALFYFSSAKLFFGLEFWRLIGFQFLHANLSHLFFNMLGLYFFGGLVEGYLGGKRYLAFYLTCGVFGGVSYLLLNLLGNLAVVVFGAGAGHIPGLLFTDMHTPLIGASAGVFGVLMAAAYIAPHAQLLLFFIIPIRLATAAYAFTALAAVNLLIQGSNAGGDAAHLGGAAAGFYFIRHTHLLRDFFDIFGSSRRKASRAAPGAPARPTGGDNQEVDRILAKVAMQGLHSLSEAERRVLRRATEARRG